jgi:hypothetical protein
MTRLVTAPCVGALLGALEGGTVFTILTIIDVQHGAYAGVNNELIYVGTLVGMIFGGLVGGVIGLSVALMNVGTVRGLVLGTLIGLAFAVFVVIRTWPLDDFWSTIAVSVVFGGASVGLVSAFLTRRQTQSAASRKSGRILS